jgi:hypothetical protein
MFAYTSMESYGTVTPQGKKVKETLVKIKNGRGTKTVVVENDYGVRADTMPLNASEIRNIQMRKFMPTLFKSSMKNIKAKTAKRRSKRSVKRSKRSRTRTAKKPKFLGLF